ncbi:MAG TPA: peptidyl-alpha-hydroxyglycine alpha-amidating lyase family protein [bacterium]|nr:peptidyl-alpha-hydroxyglycine alpha-amidating lyase family protein [bacterium]
MRVGAGEYTYEVQDNWGTLPDGWSYLEVSGVAVDRRDRLYVFNRGKHPVIVLDRDGVFLGSWGEGMFTRPHAATMAPDDTLWLVDDGDHTVRHCTLDGRVLLTIGTPNQPATKWSGEPFNRPTHVAIAADGSLYISDGYGNTRVHRFTADGRHLGSWGEPGTDPGQFNLPHNVGVDRHGRVYVADRENFRVQIFEPDGRFITQWNNLYRPCGLCVDRRGDGDLVYVGELCSSVSVSEGIRNLGARVQMFTTGGERVARIGAPLPGSGPGEFVAPHGVAVDSRGDFYVGEVSWTIRGRQLTPPRELRSLQKFVRVR